MIRLDILQAAMVAMIQDKFPADSVVFEPAEFPRDLTTDTLFSCKRKGGGETGGARAGVDTEENVPTEGVITVSGNSAVARRCIVTAAGLRWKVDVTAGTTDADFLTAIKDKLDATGFNIDAATVIVGPNLTVTGNELVSLIGLHVRGDAAVALTEQLARVTTGYETSEIQIMAESLLDPMLGGAHTSITSLRGILRRPLITILFDLRGITLLRWTDVIDLTKLRGPKWASAAAFTLTFLQRFYEADPITTVAAVAISLTDDEGGTFTQEITP